MNRLIQGTTCPACNTELLIEIGAEVDDRKFKFPSGIQINLSEAHYSIKDVWTKREKFDRIKEYLYHRLSGSPISRQDLLDCLTHRCKLNESIAIDLIEEIKVDFGASERNNMIMFA